MRQKVAFAVLFLVGATAFAADSQLMNLVMPDAQVMAGVNVTSASISPFGQYVLGQIGSNDAGLQSLITATGFDPRHDVTEILAASTGNVASPGGLVLARGTFDVAQITAAIAAKDKTQQIGTYAGATLLTGTNGKGAHALAFIGNSIAVAGDVASVRAALDRANGVNSVSPSLATQVQTLSTTQDAWSVSLASLGSLIPGAAGVPDHGAAAQTLQLVKNIQSSSGGLKFGANVVVTGQAVADTPQNATALADLIRMVSGLASMAASQNPNGAAFGQLVQSLQVTTSGAAVNLTASLPEAQIEAILNAASSKKSGIASANKL